MRLNIINTERINRVSLLYGAILAFLFALSLYIRVALPYKSVFSSTFVRFGGNDPWYNMRLVENTLHHFPHRIYFDALTHYPHGTTVPFAPLFDYLLAVIIWIIGLGNPYATLGQHGIEVIGAWYPAVLGAITVIPVYLIGKELWNRNAGLLSAALIAVLPGQFLSRSLLGFTDHHVAETLFSTIAMLFFIVALKRMKEKEITFHSLFISHDWAPLKRQAVYLFLPGFSLGIFYLMWKGAPLFVFILLIYAAVQYTIDHLRGESTDYLCIMAVPLFIIPLAMVAPVPIFNSPTGIMVLSLLLGLLVFVILGVLSFTMRYKEIEPYGYPVVILTVSVVSLVLLNAVAHPLYSTLTSQFRIFIPTESMLTVAEIHPMHIFSPYTGRITDGEAWAYFTTNFFVALGGFALLIYSIARRFRAEEVLFLVWSGVMLWACFGQNRFAYYYAVNVALLSGFASWKVIEFVAFRAEPKPVSRSAKVKRKGGAVVDVHQKMKAKTKAKAKASDGDTQARYGKITGYLRAEIIITSFIIGLVLIYPPLTASLAGAKSVGGPDYNWYESLSWMRRNTPEPGVGYYDLYRMPSVNETTGRLDDYAYPPSAYGVISWWDYGHWITRIAHRIPVANPFQQGIGGPHQGDKPGACVFFVTTDEARANEVADALGVRYVVSDFMMADAWSSFYNKYAAMTVWAGDPQRFSSLAYYYHTMEARLHIFDGRSVNVEGEDIPGLDHYRLVHESPTFILPLVIMNITTGGGYWRSYSGSYNATESEARILHGQLFSLPAGMGIEETLDNGSIPVIVKNSLNSTPLALSDDTEVRKRDENSWVIRDEKKKNIFIITRRAGLLKLSLYGVNIGQQPDMKAWTPEYINPVSYVKIFEYVKGARIEGTAPNGSIVEIATNVTTNQGREFVYSKRETSNGSYSFIVPYSTEGPVAGGTNFDVFASTYKLRAGHMENGTPVWEMEKEVHVPEEAVMSGRTIRVDLR